MSFYRPTWVEISEKAFVINLNQIRSVVGDQVRLLAVLKADGYGHGAAALARLCEKEGLYGIGISSLEEGLSLRQEGIRLPLLLLGGIYPLENFSVAVEAGITPTVASLEAAQVLETLAETLNKRIPFHLKIDTGMGRIGVSIEGARKVIEWLSQNRRIQLSGVYSHLACADSDPEFTQHQLAQFNAVREAVLAHGFQDVMFHIANSSAILRFASSFYDLVRPGLALYGCGARLQNGRSVPLCPVLAWKTRVVFLKKVPGGTSISYDRTYRTKQETEIATLPVGYADGVPRRVSNKGVVLVKGFKRPIVGRVTMDHIMIDVTGTGATVGDVVTLIGNDRDQTITVQDWASWAETVPYEIFCGISKRVPRVAAS